MSKIKIGQKVEVVTDLGYGGNAKQKIGLIGTVNRILSKHGTMYEVIFEDGENNNIFLSEMLKVI